MRATIHLATARDCLALRPLLEPVLERTFRGTAFNRTIAGIDRDELLATARALVEERPRTRAELGRLLGERWPRHDPGSLGQAGTYLLPLLQVPPRGVWGESGQATWTTIEGWLGRPLATDSSLEKLFLRYLAAYGPATVMDAQSWSGLTRLGDVVERLRPKLRTFRDHRGRELLDLPNAPRPDPDTPAPVRFLPEYDNVLLSHADRARIVSDERRRLASVVEIRARGSVLVDGFGSARWSIERERDGATLVVEPFDRLSRADRAAVADEGVALLAFLAADVRDHDVRFALTARSASPAAPGRRGRRARR
jgi:hypothetical protein